MIVAFIIAAFAAGVFARQIMHRARGANPRTSRRVAIRKAACGCTSCGGGGGGSCRVH